MAAAMATPPIVMYAAVVKDVPARSDPRILQARAGERVVVVGVSQGWALCRLCSRNDAATPAITDGPVGEMGLLPLSLLASVDDAARSARASSLGRTTPPPRLPAEANTQTAAALGLQSTGNGMRSPQRSLEMPATMLPHTKSRASMHVRMHAHARKPAAHATEPASAATSHVSADGLHVKVDRVLALARDGIKASLLSPTQSVGASCKRSMDMLAELRRQRTMAQEASMAAPSTARVAAAATETIMELVEGVSHVAPRGQPAYRVAAASPAWLSPRTDMDALASDLNSNPLRLLQLHLDAERRLARGVKVPNRASEALLQGVARGLHGGPTISNDRATDVSPLLSVLAPTFTGDMGQWERVLETAKHSHRSPLRVVADATVSSDWSRGQESVAGPADASNSSGVAQVLIDVDVVRGIAPLRQPSLIEFSIFDASQQLFVSETACVYVNASGRPVFVRSRTHRGAMDSSVAASILEGAAGSMSTAAYSPQWCQALFANVPIPLLVSGFAFVVFRCFREGVLLDSAVSNAPARPGAADDDAAALDADAKQPRDGPGMTSSVPATKVPASPGLFGFGRFLQRTPAEVAIFRRPVGVGVLHVPPALLLLPDGSPHRPDPMLLYRPAKSDDRLFFEMHSMLIAEAVRALVDHRSGSSPSRSPATASSDGRAAAAPSGSPPGELRAPLSFVEALIQPSASNAASAAQLLTRSPRLQPFPVVMRVFHATLTSTLLEPRFQHLFSPRVRLRIACFPMSVQWSPSHPLLAARSLPGARSAAAQSAAAAGTVSDTAASKVVDASSVRDVQSYARSIVVTASPALHQAWSQGPSLDVPGVAVRHRGAHTTGTPKGPRIVDSTDRPGVGVRHRDPLRRRLRRDELYITLHKGVFTQDTKLTARNVQIRAYVVLDSGEVLACISHGVRADPGDGATDTFTAEYQSAVYYHCNQPAWEETFCIHLPAAAQLHRSHLLFTSWHASSTLLKTHLFAFAYLPLTDANGVVIRDGRHQLRCFKPLAAMERVIDVPWYLVSRVIDSSGTEVYPQVLAPALASGPIGALVDAEASGRGLSPVHALAGRNRGIPLTAMPVALGDPVSFNSRPHWRAEFDDSSTGSQLGRAERSASDAVAVPLVSSSARPSAAFVAGVGGFRPNTPGKTASGANTGLLSGMFRALRGTPSASRQEPMSPGNSSTATPTTPAAAATTDTPMPAAPTPVLKRRTSVVGALALAGFTEVRDRLQDADLPVFELRKDVLHVETRLVSDVRSSTPEIHVLLHWRAHPTDEIVHALSSILRLLREPSRLFRSMLLILPTLLGIIGSLPPPDDLLVLSPSSEGGDVPAGEEKASPRSGSAPTAARRHKLLSHTLRVLVAIYDRFFAAFRPARRQPGPAPSTSSSYAGKAGKLARVDRLAGATVDDDVSRPGIVDDATCASQEGLSPEDSEGADGRRRVPSMNQLRLPAMMNLVPLEYRRLPIMLTALDLMHAPRLHDVLLPCVLLAIQAASAAAQAPRQAYPNADGVDSSPSTRSSFNDFDASELFVDTVNGFHVDNRLRALMSSRTIMQIFRSLDVIALSAARSFEQAVHQELLQHPDEAAADANIRSLFARMREAVQRILQALLTLMPLRPPEGMECVRVLQCAVLRQLPAVLDAFRSLVTPAEAAELLSACLNAMSPPDWRQPGSGVPVSVGVSQLVCAGDAVRRRLFLHAANTSAEQQGDFLQLLDRIVPSIVRIVLPQVNASAAQRSLSIRLLADMLSNLVNVTDGVCSSMSVPQFAKYAFSTGSPEASTIAPHQWSLALLLSEVMTCCADLVRGRAPAGEMLRKRRRSTALSLRYPASSSTAFPLEVLELLPAAADDVFRAYLHAGTPVPLERVALVSRQSVAPTMSASMFMSRRIRDAARMAAQTVEEDCRALPDWNLQDAELAMTQPGEYLEVLQHRGLMCLVALVGMVSDACASSLYRSAAAIRHVVAASGSPKVAEFAQNVFALQAIRTAELLLAPSVIKRSWLAVHVATQKAAIRLFGWTSGFLASRGRGTASVGSQALSRSACASWIPVLPVWRSFIDGFLGLLTCPTVVASDLSDDKTAAGRSALGRTLPQLGLVQASGVLCNWFRSAWGGQLVDCGAPHSSAWSPPPGVCAAARLALAEQLVAPALDMTHSEVPAVATLFRDLYFDLIRAELVARSVSEFSQSSSPDGFTSTPRSRRGTLQIDDAGELSLMERLSIDAVDILVKRKGPTLVAVSRVSLAPSSKQPDVVVPSEVLVNRAARVAVMDAKPGPDLGTAAGSVVNAALEARRRVRTTHDSYVPPKDNMIMSLFAPRTQRDVGTTSAEIGVAHDSVSGIFADPDRVAPTALNANAAVRASAVELGVPSPSLQDASQMRMDELLQHRVVMRFLAEIRTLYAMLTSVSQYPATSEFEEERTEAALTLIGYLRRTHRVDMYLKYVSFLVDLHTVNRNQAEAAVSKLLYADILDWSPQVLPAVHVDGKQLFPTQPSGARLEAVVLMAIDSLDRAQCWEEAAALTDALAFRYSTITFEFEKAAFMLRKKAALMECISKSSRIFPSYFGVSFFGAGFPPSTRNSMYVYRGSPGERIVEVKNRLLKKWTGASETPFRLMPVWAADVAAHEFADDDAQSDDAFTMEIGMVALTPVPYIPRHSLYDATAVIEPAAGRNREVSTDHRAGDADDTEPAFSGWSPASGMVDALHDRPFRGNRADAGSSASDPVVAGWASQVVSCATLQLIGASPPEDLAEREVSLRPSAADAYTAQLVREGRLFSGATCFVFQRPFRNREKKTGNDFLDLWIRRIYIRAAACFPSTQRRARIVQAHEVVLNPIEAAVLALREKNLMMLDTIERAAAGPDRAAEQGFSSLLQGVIDAAVSGGVANYKSFLTGDFSASHPEIADDLRRTPAKQGAVSMLQSALAQHVRLAARGVRVHAVKCPEQMLPLHEFLCKRFDSMRQAMVALGVIDDVQT